MCAFSWELAHYNDPNKVFTYMKEFICMGVLPACMCLQHMHAVPIQVRRGCVVEYYLRCLIFVYVLEYLFDNVKVLLLFMLCCLTFVKL